MALDLGLLLGGVLVKGVLLWVLVRLLARRGALTGFFRSLGAALLVSLLHSFLGVEFGEVLGVFMPIAVFVLAFVGVLVFCDATAFATLKVAVPFVLVIYGVDLGVRFGADAIAPDRIRISDVFTKMVDESQAAQAAKPDGPGLGETLKTTIARGLEGVAFFTSAEEQENMTRDLRSGLSFYNERKLMLESGEVEPLSQAEVLTLVTGISPTNTPDEIRAKVDFAITELARMEKDSATNAPPQEIMVSLRQIKANLSGEGAEARMAELQLALADVSTTLVSDARAFNSSTGTDAGVQASLSAVAEAAMGHTGRLHAAGVEATGGLSELADRADALSRDAGGAESLTRRELSDEERRGAGFGSITRAGGGAELAISGESGVGQTAALAAGEAGGWDAGDTVFVRVAVMDDEELDGTPVDGIKVTVWEEAQRQLKISGLMEVSGRDLMVFIDGELRYLNDIVDTTYQGTNFWWRVAGSRNKLLQLQRVGATVK